MRIRSSFLLIGLLVAAMPAAGAAPDSPSSPQNRSVDPVILKGSQFPAWSAGPDPTLREPQIADDPTGEQDECRHEGANEHDPGDEGNHNCYQSSRLPRNPVEGAPVARLLGYRWDGSAFVQIPFQVDERFTRYLTNNESGFAFYSGTDAHNTYAFDREGFRFTDNDPGDVCMPIPRQDPPGSGNRPSTTPDPVVGLDDDDELVFMWRDAGAQAPVDAALPNGIETAHEIVVADPSSPAEVAFAYVMLASPTGPAAEYTAANSPYVHYQRDTGPNRLGADLFVYSQSSYGGYGAAPKGPYCNRATGEAVHRFDKDGKDLGLDIRQRRPLDTAWITTPRYSFRYEGRWLMTELHISNSPEGDGIYGPDIIDRWKARAFQQDPSSETPCCGYEEEDTNWGGSSILMGERAGAVRVIRETWGADSSTNNARREIFYRDSFVWGDSLRVHPIPPLDGIYSQWDYNAGRVSTYYNPRVTAGVPIDGKNDEVLGNLDDPCNAQYDGRGSDFDETYRETYRTAGLCPPTIEYHQSIDVTDPTHSHVQALQWEQVAGPNGSLVLRTTIRDHSPGGDAQSFLAVPYYRDDSCFDDGTGTDPGPRRRERSSWEHQTYNDLSAGADLPRKCWDSTSDPIPDPTYVAGETKWQTGTDPDTGDPIYSTLGDEFGDERYFQGDIGAHGVHLLLVAESDNGYLTVPVTEIASEQRVVVLPGNPGNVGETYGRYLEYPLTAVARPR